MVIMDNTEGVGSLEGQALKRKERLKNLKRKNPNDDSNDSSSEIVLLPKPKFRSYKPQDESLQEAKIEDAKPVAVEDEVKDLLEAGKERPKGMPLLKQEVHILLELVERHPILNIKSTNATNNRLKEETWVKLTKEFNAAIASHPRSANQLRLKWENLKKNSRRRSSYIYNNSLKRVPDYVHPDAILDRVATMLKESTDHTQCSSEAVDPLLDETLNNDSMLDLPSHNGDIILVEVDEDENELPASKEDNDTHIHSDFSIGEENRKKLLTRDIQSRINRNNAIAEYYRVKTRKIEDEFVLNRDILLLERKKIEIQISDLEKSKGLIIDNDKLLLQKNKLQLEILEIQKKKYSFLESIVRNSSDDI